MVSSEDIVSALMDVGSAVVLAGVGDLRRADHGDPRGQITGSEGGQIVGIWEGGRWEAGADWGVEETSRAGGP